MPLLVDGHNLIGSDPDISLADPQDEMLLIQKLQTYCRSRRRSIVVYFDRGSFPSQSAPAASLVTVRFVRPPRSADDEIIAHLRSLGGEAKNWTVITSDRQLQAAARELGAGVLRSDEFLTTMKSAGTEHPDDEKPTGLSEEEIQEWERLFRAGSPDTHDDQEP